MTGPNDKFSSSVRNNASFVDGLCDCCLFRRSYLCISGTRVVLALVRGMSNALPGSGWGWFLVHDPKQPFPTRGITRISLPEQRNYKV